MRIVWTRPRDRGVAAREALEAAGHEVLCVPLIEIVDGDPFPDPTGYDGVLFTSVAAVERVPEGGSWPRVGAVGPTTAAALRDRGIEVDVVGTGGGAELGAAWGFVQGQRLLLPQAREAHPDLAHVLETAGAEVDAVAVYETRPLGGVDPSAFDGADRIEFFAPSAVRAFVALHVETSASFGGLGQTTRAAMAEAGLPHTDLRQSGLPQSDVTPPE